MRLRVVLTPTAEHELKEAIAWHEQQRKGLGKRLRLAVSETIRRIRVMPESRTIVYPPDVRRIRVDVFSYQLFYRVVGSEIRVVSVFHTSRDPAHWQKLADDDRRGREDESAAT
jgi:plasmid stabilization system protein ParE